MRRESRKVKNNLIIGMLCSVVMIMAVAYALANTSLNINTTTNISSTWNILITDIRQDNNGQATGTNSIDSALSASFSANLVTPKDSVVYHVDVTNNGNLNATLTDIKKKITNKSQYININFSGFTKGETLNAGETKTLDITVTFDYDDYGNFIDTIESNIDISLDFAQEGSISAPDRSYGITYDCTTNGGNDCSSYNTTLSDNEVDLSYKAEKEGYEFVGWNTDKNATTGLKNIDAEDGLVLYAIYKKDITITYEIGSKEITSIGKTSETYTLFNNVESYEVTLPSILLEDDNKIAVWYDGTKLAGTPEDKYGVENSVTIIAKSIGKPIMKSYSEESGNSNSDFHNWSYLGNATALSIVDLSKVDAPDVNTGSSWDVSEAHDGSVIAWMDSGHLYIGGIGGVIAPVNSSSLFSNAYDLKTIDIELLDTSKVTNMSSMFAGIGLSQFNLDDFDTTSVTDMSYMFNNCYNLTSLDLSNFDTSKVTSMESMFQSSSNFKSLNLSDFSTSNVTNMSNMFKNCQSLLELDLSDFDTSNVTNMDYMFGNEYGENKLTTIYVSDNFVTTNVASSQNMFKNCVSLVGGNGTKYSEAGVIDASYARIDADETPGYFTSGKDIIIKNLSVKTTATSITVVAATTENDGEITKYEFMLSGEEGTFDENLAYTLEGNTIIKEEKIRLSSSKKLDGTVSTKWIDNGTNNTYTFNNLNKDQNYTVSVKVTTKNNNEYTKSVELKTQTLLLPTFSEKKIENGKSVTINYSKECGNSLTCTYSINGEEDINVTTLTKKLEFTSSGSIVAKVSDGKNEVSSSYTISMGTMMKSYSRISGNYDSDFHGYDVKNKITSIDIVDLNLVTAPEINNTTSWDVSVDGNGGVIAWLEGTSLYIGGDGGVLANTDCSSLFAGFGKLERANLKLLDTSSVTNMSRMFEGESTGTGTAPIKEYDVSNFDTSNVTDMSSMFYGTNAITIDVSNFDTSKVTNMYWMFAYSPNLNNLDLSNWNTSNVTNMEGLFSCCPSFEILDLSSFDTSNVTTMNWMFSGHWEKGSSLKTIYVSDKFVTKKVDASQTIFDGLDSLVGGNGTTFDSNHTNKEYARIDSADTPGYFTNANTSVIKKLSTRTTTNSIEAMVITEENIEISKYEFKIDDKDWQESLNNQYIFNDLKEGLIYTVYVKITTSDGSSYIRSVNSITKSIAVPTYSEKISESGKTIKIIYNSGCTNGLTCTYSINGGEFEETTEKTVIIDFNATGTIIAKVSDGKQEISSSYTVSLKPMIKSYAGEWGSSSEDFHEWNYSQNITSVDIVDLANTDLTVPEINNETSWDVSEAGDGSVIAWLENDNTKLYIGGNGGVLANPNSAYLFANFSNVTTINLELLDTSNVTNMRGMFNYCQKLSSLDLSNFNTSNVTDMSQMFSGGNFKALNLNSFDTSKVTDMNSMFYACYYINELDLSNWNTSNVTDMSGMFSMCRGLSNLDLSNFNTSKVTNMNNMFYECNSLSLLDIGNFNTSKVTNMNNMFYECHNLTELDLSSFDTSKVTDMSGMFGNSWSTSHIKTIYVSNKFVTTKVASSYSMFHNYDYLVGGNGTKYDESINDKTYARIDKDGQPGYFTDIKEEMIEKITATTTTHSINVVVSTTEKAGEIIKYEYSLDGKQYDEQESNIYTFGSLEEGNQYTIYVKATSSNNDVYTKNITTRTKKIDLPTYSEKTIENGKKIKISYPSGCSNGLKCMYSVNGGTFEEVTENSKTLEFTSAGTIVAKISDDNQEISSSYTVSMKSMMKYWATNADTDFHNSTYKYNIISVDVVDLNNTEIPENAIQWDVSVENNGGVIAWLETDANDSSKYNLYIGGKGGVMANPDSSYLFTWFNIKTANLSLLDTSNVVDMEGMFEECRDLTTLNLSNWNTSNVTNMERLFRSSKITNLDLSSFNTSSVTNMSYMFHRCGSLTSLDVGNFNTSNVTNMSGMFGDCGFSTLDLSNFDTSKVTDMSGMFFGSNKLTSISLSNFNTSKVTDMSYMFSGTSLTSLDVSNFDTSRVTTMFQMFNGYSGSTLDVSYFDTSNVTNMENMFSSGKFTSLDLSNFDTSKVTNMNDMFAGCNNLVSLNLSSFDTSNVTNMYGMFYCYGWNGLSSLTTIYVSDKFVTTNVTNSDNMFYNCNKLVGGNGTTFDSSHQDKTYARIDKEGQPGYFTNGYTLTLAANPITASSITAVVSLPAAKQIVKYEFKIDDGDYIDKEKSNTHKFTGLTHNTSHTIYVKVTTKDNKEITKSKTITTTLIDIPTYTDTETDDGIDVTIKYPSGNYKYEYSLDGINFEEVTVNNDNEYTVSFTESGSVIARVTDNTNSNNVVTASSHSVEINNGVKVGGQIVDLVTEGDGLYLDEDTEESNRYVYKGTNPNNYICLNDLSNDTCPADSLYRIISIESDGTLKVVKNISLSQTVRWDLSYYFAETYNDTVIKTVNSSVGTRYSNTSTDYCYSSSGSGINYEGCNSWGNKTTTFNSIGSKVTTMPWQVNGTTKTLPTYNSWINVYLNGGMYYKNSTTATTNITGWYEGDSNGLSNFVKTKVDTAHLHNIGKTTNSENTTLLQEKKQEAQYKWKGTVGLINITDYVSASANSACTNMYSSRIDNNSNCKDNNYLFNNEDYWTMSSVSNSIYNYRVYYVSSNGETAFKTTRFELAIRPVMFLSKDVTLLGSGTNDKNVYTIS